MGTECPQNLVEHSPVPLGCALQGCVLLGNHEVSIRFPHHTNKPDKAIQRSAITDVDDLNPQRIANVIRRKDSRQQTAQGFGWAGGPPHIENLTLDVIGVQYTEMCWAMREDTDHRSCRCRCFHRSRRCRHFHRSCRYCCLRLLNYKTVETQVIYIKYNKILVSIFKIVNKRIQHPLV